jgi:GT2 family glycosyltransferase
MNTVDISIVIGTYNRADVLRQALASLAALETDGRFTYEIVVVDNASTDDTSAVVAEANASNADAGHAVAVRGFVEPRKGVAAARNHAIRESRGRWIAFHDDDQMAEPRWLAELLSLANEKSCLVVGGDVRLVLPESNERQLSRVCRRLLGEMIDMPEVCRFSRRVVPGTNNLMIERTVFDTVGLFDEQMLTGGEDAELYRRIRTCGFECWYTPRAVVHHIIPEFRLADDYMRWTSMRQGEHVALREQQDWGRGAHGASAGELFATIRCRPLDWRPRTRARRPLPAVAFGRLPPRRRGEPVAVGVRQRFVPGRHEFSRRPTKTRRHQQQLTPTTISRHTWPT